MRGQAPSVYHNAIYIFVTYILEKQESNRSKTKKTKDKRNTQNIKKKNIDYLALNGLNNCPFLTATLLVS